MLLSHGKGFLAAARVGCWWEGGWEMNCAAKHSGAPLQGSSVGPAPGCRHATAVVKPKECVNGEMHVLREKPTVRSLVFIGVVLFRQKVAPRTQSSDLFLIPSWENRQNTFELFFLDHFAHLHFFLIASNIIQLSESPEIGHVLHPEDAHQCSA